MVALLVVVHLKHSGTFANGVLPGEPGEKLRLFVMVTEKHVERRGRLF